MFGALLKSRFQSLLYSMFRGSKNKSKAQKSKSLGMKLLVGVLAVYVIAVFIMMFGMIFYQLCEPFHELKVDWLYFTFAAVIAFALMFIGSIFITYAQLYEAKDNELLLSMPIPPKYILASRMVMLYAFNLLFEVLVMGPAVFVYQSIAGYSAVGMICMIILMIFLPFLSLALSCILGWVLALISSRMRNKSLITMILSLAFLAAYFYFYSQMNQYINQLIVYALTVADAIKGAAVPLYWFGEAMSSGNFLYLGFCLLIAVVPFAIVYAALSASFLRLATTKRGFKKIQYKAKELKVSSVDRALLTKEMKHFLSSPMYMMNASLGVVFTVVAVITMIIKRADLLTFWAQFEVQMPELAGNTGIILALVLAAMSTMNIITAPSISLEGKTLWILHSFPVKEESILKSKLNLQLLITMPPILFGEIVGAFLFKMDVWNLITLLVFPLALNYLCAILGLIINLHFPKFDWISEAVAVKQSASTMVSMFANMGIVIAIVLLYLLLLEGVMTLAVYGMILTAAFIVINALLYLYLVKKGTKMLRFM